MHILPATAPGTLSSQPSFLTLLQPIIPPCPSYATVNQNLVAEVDEKPAGLTSLYVGS